MFCLPCCARNALQGDISVRFVTTAHAEQLRLYRFTIIFTAAAVLIPGLPSAAWCSGCTNGLLPRESFAGLLGDIDPFLAIATSRILILFLILGFIIAVIVFNVLMRLSKETELLLRHRLQLDTIITALSARFVNTPVEEVEPDNQ